MLLVLSAVGSPYRGPFRVQMFLHVTRATALFALLAQVVVASACSDNPAAPTPTLKTETFSGTLSPLGLVSHTFDIEYSGYSDASVMVTRLAAASDSTDRAITIGVGFGTVNVGVCTRAAAYTNPTADLNVELTTSGGAFLNGSYCVAIFDNTDAPTAAEPLLYTMVVKHY